MQTKKFFKAMLLAAATLSLTACGVHVHDSDGRSSYGDTAFLSLYRIDPDFGDQTRLTTTCIDLDQRDWESIEVIDDSGFYTTTLTVKWSNRDSHLALQMEENGLMLHRSYHRQTYFEDGGDIEQRVVAENDAEYLLLVEGQGC